MHCTDTEIPNNNVLAAQDMVLFNDTIRYNIEYGRLGAGEAAVHAAARQVPVPRSLFLANP